MHFGRIAFSACICVAASGAAAQVIALVKEGDAIPGVGNVTLINNIQVNNSGLWMVEADTDAATTEDLVLLKNGAVFLREGQPLPGVPAGSVTLSSFDAVSINNAGVFAGNIFLNGTGSTSLDSGVYQDANLVLQESTISTAPEFSANTPYIGWFEVKLNNSGQHLTMSSVDDPAIASTVDRAIVRWDVGPAGNLILEKVIAKEGDILAGTTQAVADFGTGPHDFAFNDAGNAMFSVDGNGTTTDDFAVYVGANLVAREGSPSPVAGRNYSASGLGSTRLDLNNNGDYVFTATLDGDTTTDNIIIRNNNKFIQEGDTLPSIGGVFTFTSFGTSTPVDIDDNGNVLWFGDWNDPDTTRDTGLFLNDQLIVQEGVTQVDGVTILTLAGVEEGFHISNNGQYVIFEATLTGGIDGAFMVVIPEPAGVCAVAGILALGMRRRRE